MGFSKEEKSRRVLKTVFFLITMGISFLVFSAPVFLVLADAVLPCALLSASLSPSYLSVKTLRSYFENYDFRSSLIDIPIISVVRSAVIICVYSLCDGPKLSRGPYLGSTMKGMLMLVQPPKLLFSSLHGLWQLHTSLWPTEPAAEKEESYSSTKSTSKPFQLARMGSQGTKRFSNKKEQCKCNTNNEIYLPSVLITPFFARFQI
ncbi:hypothetical protein GQ457_01G044270 [Hibiscus cannabinus]